MLGLDKLKPKIRITSDEVECPVIDCSYFVIRQKNNFKKQPAYKCPQHNIYISPSTFEYENKHENILWKEVDDLNLLAKISAVKRESRMARDNSEDAVTWNVFRFLEKKGYLKGFLKEIFGIEDTEPEIIYWSYSQVQKKLWDALEAARQEFELLPSKGSEPDIIILGKSTLLFVEVKLTASNNTMPSTMKVKSKYLTGGQRWWGYVFQSDFDTVTVLNKKYELARFWLLGTWIAHRMGLQFVLVTLVLKDKDLNIEPLFLPHIKPNIHRKFERIGWEDIYEKVILHSKQSADKGIILSYFQNKTLGYRNGELIKAFYI